MEMFCFGILAGMIVASLLILAIKENEVPKVETLEPLGAEVLEQLCSDLYTIREVTGLSRHEREVLDTAATYIIQNGGLIHGNIRRDMP